MSNVPLAIFLSLPKLKMAGFRNSGWKDDLILKETLQKHVKDGLCREEILDFVARDFEQYPWSIRTVDRRLRHFEIYYHDRTVSVEQVQEAVREELQGPGKLLGYASSKKFVNTMALLCQETWCMLSCMNKILLLWKEEPLGLRRRKRRGTSQHVDLTGFTV